MLHADFTASEYDFIPAKKMIQYSHQELTFAQFFLDSIARFLCSIFAMGRLKQAFNS
jgi:hypothetical protein